MIHNEALDLKLAARSILSDNYANGLNYHCCTMDKSILKVYLPNGGFNVVKCGDATDVKVRELIFT